MTVDWLATLAEQGDIAKRKATEVATLVVKPELPLEIASRLYRDVEKGAQTFDRILSDMEDADASDELLEAPMRSRNCGASFPSHLPTSYASCKAPHQSR